VATFLTFPDYAKRDLTGSVENSELALMDSGFMAEIIFMSITSKSPRAILVTAFEIAADALPAYSHANSPKKYTQHQIFACLVLKSSMKLDYRGVHGLLLDSADLRSAIGLRKTPHWTTFQKACDRLLNSPCAAALLDATVAPKQGARSRTRRSRRTVKTAAVDSSGFDTHHSSRYFVARKSKGSESLQHITYRRYPKLGIVCDCGDHMILADSTGTGPRPDVDEFRGLVRKAAKRAEIDDIVADAGYDSEPNHEFAREIVGIESHIPAKIGRPGITLPRGQYRRQMRESFEDSKYAERCQVETVMSMIKRRQGPATSGRSYQARCRDLRLMSLTHNIMIL